MSLAVVLPAYAAIDGIAHPLIFPASLLAVQALVQGGLQGVITITAYFPPRIELYSLSSCFIRTV